jgi:hypothetical protein
MLWTFLLLVREGPGPGGLTAGTVLITKPERPEDGPQGPEGKPEGKVHAVKKHLTSCKRDLDSSGGEVWADLV